MTDDEMREKVRGLATTHSYVPLADFESMILRWLSKPAPPITRIAGFVQAAFELWPNDMPALVRLQPNERKAMLRMVRHGEEMYLKLRAAQLYQRACWLTDKENKP